MSLRLWGRPSSVNVQKALWALDEFGLSYAHEVVGGKYGGLDRPEFAALTPARRVPVLEDGGIVVWESHAVLRHLGRCHPDHPLGMADPGRAARIDPWMEFGATTLQPPFIALFWQLVRMRPHERDESAMVASRKAIAEALAVPERALSDGRDFLAGDFSLADIALGSLFHRLFDLAPDLRAACPAVDAWHGRLCARPAHARHVAVSYEELRVV
jgi:glutathione S-transferase